MTAVQPNRLNTFPAAGPIPPLADVNQQFKSVEASQGNDPIPDALYDVLFKSPSLFGRLLKISSCRDASTGRYQQNVASTFRAVEVSDGLGHLHLEIFTKWLNLSLAKQAADIAIYLRAGGAANGRSQLGQLLQIAEQAIPVSAMIPERQLFLHDLSLVKVILEEEL